MVIAAEDVGLADPSLILYEKECLDSFENLLKQYGLKKSQAFKNQMLCDVVDRAVIAAAISYKSRILPMLSFATFWDIYENEDFSENVYTYFDRFVDALGKEDEKQALYYAYVVGIFFDHMDRILTWVQRQSERRNKDLIEQWIEGYKSHDELLMLVGCVVLLCRDVDYTHEEYKDSIYQYLSIPIKKAKIPNRAYDMHTRAGKNRDRGFNHFFNIAGTIKNERFPNNWEKAGRNAYFLADKKGLGKAKKIIKAINKKLRASLILEMI
jgi:hypothetical protein